MDKASALPPCRHRIKAQRLSAAKGFYNNSVWAMGLAARPTAAGFVSSALTRTSPSHIYLCASLCATPRSLFHWKLAYIHCLILISHSVGSIKAKGNEPQAIRPGCCLPPAEGWTQSVHQPNLRRCWQLSPALRNSRQSLPLDSDLNLTKPLLTGQRISKKPP